MMKIYIDADACPRPVKEVVIKAATKAQIKVILVANSYMNIPMSPFISLVQVEKGDDVADLYIVDHVSSEDLVITADIPLADLIVKKDAMAINPRGEVYTEENISERLSVRNFMQELRDNGMDTGGPPPFGTKDKAAFANSLNKIMTRKLKG